MAVSFLIEPFFTLASFGIGCSPVSTINYKNAIKYSNSIINTQAWMLAQHFDRRTKSIISSAHSSMGNISTPKFHRPVNFCLKFHFFGQFYAKIVAYSPPSFFRFLTNCVFSFSLFFWQIRFSSSSALPDWYLSKSVKSCFGPGGKIWIIWRIFEDLNEPKLRDRKLSPPFTNLKNSHSKASSLLTTNLKMWKMSPNWWEKHKRIVGGRQADDPIPLVVGRQQNSMPSFANQFIALGRNSISRGIPQFVLNAGLRPIDIFFIKIHLSTIAD